MRIMCCGSLVLCLVVSLVRAEDQAKARAIIDKALQAAGGEEKLAKFKAQTFDEKGTYYGSGNGQPYTGTYSLQWPDRYRMEIKDVFTMVVTSDKGWVKSEQGTVELTKEQLAGEHEKLYCGYVAHLLPLKDKAYMLTLLPETKIEDKPVLGVKVSHKGKPDVLLYFDKTTGLLAGSEYKVHNFQNPMGMKVKQEASFSEYKEFQGCKVPTKIVLKHDGKLFVEAVMLDVKLAEKLDDSVFAKP